MTAILDAPATPVVASASPRSMLDPWPGLFSTLAAYVAEHQEVTPAYAERVVEQTLIWLEATRTSPDRRVGMSAPVDPGWHAFMLHSAEYTEFCQQVFGFYLHHVPPSGDAQMSVQELDGTVPALLATRFGGAVDAEFWGVISKSCCPPDPGTRVKTAKCTGTGAPPPAA